MADLDIVLVREDGRFEPGEKVSGKIKWSLDAPPEAIALNLLWVTSGKGTRDMAVVDSVRFETKQATGYRDFSLALPEEPYSYSGVLLSITWALEIIVEPSDDTQRLEIVVGPDKTEIVATSVESSDPYEGAP